MFKKFLKNKRHDYELMCKDFTRALSRVIFDERMEELKDKFEVAKKGCKFENKPFGPDGALIPVLTEPTEEFIQIYNRDIIDYSIHLTQQIGVYNLKRKGSKMLVWCDRPGLIIGCKGKTVKKLLEELNHNTFNTKRTHLDKIKALKFVGSYNPFVQGAYSLQYNYAVRKGTNIDDL